MTLDKRVLEHGGGAGEKLVDKYRVTVPDPDVLDRL